MEVNDSGGGGASGCWRLMAVADQVVAEVDDGSGGGGRWCL